MTSTHSMTSSSTFMTTRKSTKSLQEITQNIDLLNQKISAQKQFSSREELASVGKFHSFAANIEDIARAEDYQENLSRVLSQMQQTDVVISNMIADISEAKAFITSALSPIRPSLDLDSRIKEHLDTLVSSLNAKFNDQYLFAGYDANEAPVNLEVLNTSNLVFDSKNQIWTPTANYAVGDQSKKTVMIDDSISLEQNLVASAPVFQKLIGAYHQIMSNTSDQDNLQKGFDALDAAFRELTTTRADFGSKIGRVENAISSWNQKHEEFTREYQTEYGNNLAVMAGLMSNMRAFIDSKEQNLDLMALLLRTESNILSKL